VLLAADCGGSGRTSFRLRCWCAVILPRRRLPAATRSSRTRQCSRWPMTMRPPSANCSGHGAGSRRGHAPLRQRARVLMNGGEVGLPLDDAIAALAKRVGSEELRSDGDSPPPSRASWAESLAELLERSRAPFARRFRAGGADLPPSIARIAVQGLIVAALQLSAWDFSRINRRDLIAPMFETAYGTSGLERSGSSCRATG